MSKTDTNDKLTIYIYKYIHTLYDDLTTTIVIVYPRINIAVYLVYV
jgi:hypothetical protein